MLNRSALHRAGLMLYAEKTEGEKAKAFLDWWYKTGFEHNAFKNWTEVIATFEQATNDKETADYLRAKVQELNGDPNVAIGPFAIDTPFMKYLFTVLSTTPDDFALGHYLQPVIEPLQNVQAILQFITDPANWVRGVALIAGLILLWRGFNGLNEQPAM